MNIVTSLSSIKVNVLYRSHMSVLLWVSTPHLVPTSSCDLSVNTCSSTSRYFICLHIQITVAAQVCTPNKVIMKAVEKANSPNVFCCFRSRAWWLPLCSCTQSSADSRVYSMRAGVSSQRGQLGFWIWTCPGGSHGSQTCLMGQRDFWFVVLSLTENVLKVFDNAAGTF